MTPAYQLTSPSAHLYRPTLSRPEMESLTRTKDDLVLMIARTREYMKSPHSDRKEKLHLEGFVHGLQGQLDDIERQLSEQT